MDNAGMKIAGNLTPKMPMRSDKDIYMGEPGGQSDGFFKLNGKPVRCVVCKCRRFYKEVTGRLAEDTPIGGLKGCPIAHDIFCIQCKNLAAKEIYGVYERTN